jgi:hypothetical protein
MPAVIAFGITAVQFTSARPRCACTKVQYVVPTSDATLNGASRLARVSQPGWLQTTQTRNGLSPPARPDPATPNV